MKKQDTDALLTLLDTLMCDELICEIDPDLIKQADELVEGVETY